MLGKEKILVVDDEKTIREIIKRYLELMGHRAVQEAADAGEALEAIKKTGFALILTDIHMPGENGLWLLEKVQEHSPDTRVVMFTASDDLTDAITSLNRGADRYLVKPLNIEEVRHAVASSMEKRRLIMENRDYQSNLEEKVRLRTEEISKYLHALDAANREIKTAYVETVYRLTVTAEYRDEETGAHIKRIGYYAGLLADKLGFPAEEAELLSRVASMHDIGKVGIPDDILRKKDTLSPGEFEIMKTHTTIGASMLKGSSSKYLRMAEKIALTHHENWDGTGYPAGLKGKDIPVEGRIIRLADVYDALRSKRPYKPAIDHQSVCRIITAGDEKSFPGQFDPAVLELFNKIAMDFALVFEKNQ